MPGLPPTLLAVNTGSSSLKYGCYPVRDGQVQPACLTGIVEGLERDEAEFEAALLRLVTQLQTHPELQVRAIVHRVVHGGERYRKAVIADDAVLAALVHFNPLAPLHQPHNLAGIRRLRALWPDIPQIACFDTAFHATLPESESHFALPESFFHQGIRRYGFHGLSYRHVCDALQEASARAQGRCVLAHLGNGASLCAVREGQSHASTMGFTALDGLMMGTRCGAIDPGVRLYLLRQGWTLGRLESLLYRQSGLLGVSGLSADLRVLRASTDPAAQRAIALFTARVVREAGAMAALLGGVELMAFTGGIGEHDARLRADVAERLGHLGMRLDPARNEQARGQGVMAIHAADSAVEVWVVPADEGHSAAREAWQLLSSGLLGNPMA